MRRAVWLGLALVVIGLVGAAALAREPEPVYSVAEVRAALSHHPRSWLGRTVWIRGMVFVGHGPPCPGTRSPYCFHMWLADRPPSISLAPVLPLEAQSPDAFLEWLRHLPILSAVVPPTQVLRPNQMGVYRLQLRRLSQCPANCMVGILL